MKRNSSTSGRLKGVYLRGKKYWYRYSYEGRQYREPLDTEDEAEAIFKAMRIRANPLLIGANPLAEEIKAYLVTKQEKGIYTRNSADSREPVLRMWAKARNLREVREIDADAIKLWLNSLRKEPKPEKQGRRKHRRKFLSWLRLLQQCEDNSSAPLRLCHFGFCKIWA